MKQHITIEQWEEINSNKKVLFWKKCGMVNSEEEILKDVDNWHYLIDIGRMIEFIGDDYPEALLYCRDGDIKVFNDPKDVCDALWIACKQKLK